MKNENKKAIRCAAVFAALAMGFGGCAAGAETNRGSMKLLGESGEGTAQVKRYGYEQNAVPGYKTVAFEETEDLCADNEGMGWVILEEPLYGGLPSLGYKGVYPEVKQISMSTGWSVVETSPGEFNWTVLDETIAYWVEQGKTINLRLCTDGLVLNQGVVNGCPAWLFEAPYNVPSVVHDGQTYADLSNEKYMERLKIFLEEFATHYTSEDYPYADAIEVVELRGYGMVGEWHSGWSSYGSLEDRSKMLCDVIDAWREAWGDKLLILSCTYEFGSYMTGMTNAASYEDFMYYMGYDHALQQDNIGWRRDGIAFALQEYDSRFANDYFYLNTGVPLCGELGDGYAKHGDDSPYPLFEALSEALHKWRVNYNTAVGWVAQDFADVVKNDKECVEYFNRMMGFRFVPDTVSYSHGVKAGDKFYLNSLWSNNAMGRCWKDYDLSVYFEDADGNTVYTGTDESFNPASINGGEPHFFDLEYDLPASLPAGTYTVKFAMTDKNGVPKIEMPIAGKDADKKYYLGEVTVGDTAAKKLAEADSLDGDTAFKAIGTGKITDRLVTVNGSKAIVGGGDGVFAEGMPLENGKTYYVSFDYKTNIEKSAIKINMQSKYLVGAYNAENGVWGDKYEWLDVSNNVSHRTATITVPDDGKQYKLSFGAAENAAVAAFDDISAVTADKQDVGFKLNPAFATKEEDGSYTIYSQNTPYWADGLQLKNELGAHETYMLTFDAATTTEISGGGFFYAMITDPNADPDDKNGYIESFSLNRIGSFWKPADTGYTKYSYVFNTDDYPEGSHVVFGVRDRGGVNIKNITLTKLSSDESYTRDAVAVKHNVVPEKGIDADGKGVVENFEAGVFNGGCMYPGIGSTGIISGNPEYLISGKYSCYVDNTHSTGNAWEFNVFCNTNLADMCLSVNTTYRLKFKYKVVKDESAADGGYFYCLAREEGTFLHDTGVYEWRKGDYEIGEVYSVEYEFTTGSQGRYYLMWGIRFGGAMAIDDVVIEKVETPSGQTKPKITKGHAYTVTDEVLYKR